MVYAYLDEASATRWPPCRSKKICLQISTLCFVCFLGGFSLFSPPTFSMWSSVVFPALSRPRKSSFACLFVRPSDWRTSQTIVAFVSRTELGEQSLVNLLQLKTHSMSAKLTEKEWGRGGVFFFFFFLLTGGER